MASIIKVQDIQNSSGANIINESSNTITIGASGDNIIIPSGATFDVSSATVTGTGITEADQWRLSANTNTDTNADITTNWERVDSDGFGYIGTGLTETSGIFSFPTTGIYLLIINIHIVCNDSASNVFLDTTEDNSTYSAAAIVGTTNSVAVAGVTNQFIFDVTDITTHKFKLRTSSFSAGTTVGGNTDRNSSSVTAIRLGDT